MNIMIWINQEQIVRVGDVFKRLEIAPDNFLDPRYYPSEKDDYELVISYFTTMVSIDHRTSMFTKYRLKISEEYFEGADLLWRLGKEMYDKDPKFFTPEKLKDVDVSIVRRWLCPNDMVELWDINIRTILLRDLGKKTYILYNGKFSNIFKESNGYIRGSRGIAELLKIYRAYEDPVEKKIFLLLKFLHRRKLVNIKDFENIEIPVDNHLTRIAIRLGIVNLDEKIIKYIQDRVEVSYNLDVEIRLTIRKAWKEVSKICGKDVTILDDYLWNHGRKVCTYENPRCEICDLKSVCNAHMVGTYLTEHEYRLTWYY